MKSHVFSLLAFLLLTIFLRAQPGTTWSEKGPIAFPANVSGQINGIGRCTQLKVNPSNPARLYTTSASGGLWSSNDTGKTWINLGTDFLPRTECASVCFDPTNSNTIYLGTGDPNYYSGGYGVYKTTNGGASWTSFSTGISTGLIIELIMHPSNNQTLLAATNSGIFKTTNGGSSWTQVKTGGDFKAMVLKPNSNDTAYAVTSSQIWRSVDFGNTWQQITSGVTIPGGNGQGMRLAVSKASPNVVYVGMIADEGTILKSTDFGTTFSTVYNNPAQSLVGYDASSSGQGDYNFSMTCDPGDANVVYVAAHCVWKSLDGGLTWTKLTDWWDGCHTDMHGISVHPVYNNMLFNVNDGGIFLSRDGGANWTSRSDGIAATEIYHGSQSQIRRDLISIGTQDNGELYGSTNSWFTNRGGDWGSKSTFNYREADVVYYYENGKRRTVLGSENSYNLPFAGDNKLCLEFNRNMPTTALTASTNIYVSKNITSASPNWLQAGSINTSIVALHSSFADTAVVYAFGSNNTLYRCDNIFAASPVYTTFPAPAGTAVAASITSIGTNSNVIYVSCGNKVYRSANRGQSFTNISTGLPAGVNIIKVQYEEFSTNEGVYLCTAKGMYYRNSSMSSWQNISYNLPTVADIVGFSMYNPGNASALLRVFYYGRGVWEMPINTSMPPAVDFIADQVYVCPGSTVHFTDQSISTPAPNSWQWTFQGGSPSSSTSQNPSVTYNATGVYQVTLTVGNTNGNNTLVKTAYIHVTSPHVLPVQEAFAGTYPPVGWNLVDDGSDGVVWQHNTTVGGFGTSSESSYFDNYSVDVSPKRDAFVTEGYDLANVTGTALQFDVAYARWGSGVEDSLEVLISGDCGMSYASIYLKGGSTLATAPDEQQLFIPDNSEWRTETIHLSAYDGNPRIQFAFKNRGHYGNALYVDNINLTSFSAIQKQQAAGFSSNISPNPARDKTTLTVSAKGKEKMELVVSNSAGQVVQRADWIIDDGVYAREIDLTGLAKGFYTVSLKGKDHQITEKLIIY